MKSTANLIYGRHPVLEALLSGKPIDKLLLQNVQIGPELKEILDLARENGIPIQRTPKEKINKLVGNYGGKNINHQGVVALISLIQYFEIDDVLALAYDKGEIPLFILLDGITDVRNFGAIARSAECFGVHALIIPEKGSAQINPIAIKASSGALNTMHVCRVSDIGQAISELKLHGIQIIATDLKAKKPIEKADLTVPLAMIFGSEGEGLDKSHAAMCDERLIIPMQGTIDSLNVSVSAGVFLYEVQRQRAISKTV